MSLQLCGAQGGNTGGVPCAVAPDKMISMAIWAGTLTPAEYATQAAIKTAWVADSKLPKASGDKLFLLPLRLGIESKKQSNTDQTFSNGVSVVAREGLPGIRFSFKTSQQQNAQLRKFNNKEVKLIYQDAAKNVWGSADSDNNFIGRKAILFFEGLDSPMDDATAGIGYVTVVFLDAIENYDESVFVAPGFNFQTTLKTLYDVTLVEKAVSTEDTAPTAATRTVTLTGVGADNDTIDIPGAAGNSISGVVIKTASESTVTLLAVKVKNAINALGIEAATNVAGVLTITGPLSEGANTTDPAPTIVGTMTATHTAYTGGANGVRAFHLTGRVPTANIAEPLDIYEDYALSLFNVPSLWNIKNMQTGAAVAVLGMASNVLGYGDLTMSAAAYRKLTAGTDRLLIYTDDADDLDAANVKGIEVTPLIHTKPV